MSDSILREAKAALAASISQPYPAELTVSDWWQGRLLSSHRVIPKFTSVAAAIERAQIGRSGFDHRQESRAALQTINFKLAELQFRFPNFDIRDRPELCESPLSISTGRTSDGKLLSSIFLTHLYFYLRTQTFCASGFSRILEIGPGYGGLARIYKLMQSDITYVLVDLPESLFYAQVFLTANFPDARVCYVQDELPAQLDDYDFVFVPAQRAQTLAGQEFDLVLNTGSLQEMTTSAVGYWMDFIQTKITARLFYSWNYFLNDKALFTETSTHFNQICPVLDPYWKLRYFRINDPVITVDCAQRNWLEVCVERIPAAEQATFNLEKYTHELVDAANAQPAGTNYWFANMWMAIWVNPAENLLDAMLTYLDYFVQGKTFGIFNHLPNVTEFDETRFYRNLRQVQLD